MSELQGTNAWTLALLFGLAWVMLSGAVALALGRIIARSKDAGRREQGELSAGENDAFISERAALALEAADEDAHAGTRTSGTRLRPVHVAHEGREQEWRRRVS
jgi:hypothetical protein